MAYEEESWLKPKPSIIAEKSEPEQYTLFKHPIPLGSRNDNKIVNELMNTETGELVGYPFVIGSQLCVIVKKPAAALPAAEDALKGGKSRSKNSYKKYMKKTRKRN
jgi:hypothetical protein